MAEDFNQRLPYLVRMISNVLSAQLDQTLRGFSLTHAQLAVLAQLGLAHPNPLSGAEMAHRAGITAQAVSGAIASLAERGLVSRSPSPSHGRVVDVTITEEGADLLDRVQVATKRVDERAVATMTPKQARQLKDLLHQLMASLGREEPDTANAAR